MQRHRIEPYSDRTILDPNGEWVKFADVPAAPEPLPWLDQPDGAGWWKIVYNDGEKTTCGLFVKRFRALRVLLAGSGEMHDLKKIPPAKYQRVTWDIPQPTLPVEDAT